MSTAASEEAARPGRGRRRAEIVCITGIVARGLFGLAMLFLSPSLIGTDPVLLEALRGSTSALAAGGAFSRVGQASLPLAVLAPLPTLLFITPFYWWAGRLWGPRAAAVVTGQNPSAEKWARRASYWLERFGGLVVFLAPILPVPAALIFAAAGWTGMGFLRFLFFDVLGTLGWVCLIVGLGYGIGHPAVHVAKEISHYGLQVTIGLVVLVVIIAAIRGYLAERAAQRAAAETSEPPLR